MENEGIHKPAHALTQTAGLILLLTEKLAAQSRDPDEHNQTDILTSGMSLAPAFPEFLSSGFVESL